MVGIIRFDLAAQSEQHTQELGLPYPVTTGSGHQLRARGNDLFGVCGEKNQKVELFLCQLHLVASNGNSSGLEIDAKIAGLDDLGGWRPGLGPWPNPTPNAGEDLLEVHWVCHFTYLGSEPPSRTVRNPIRWATARDRKP